MPSCVYLVSSPLIKHIKVGIWSSSEYDLYTRYMAVYGTETMIHVFEHDDPRAIEKTFKDTFDSSSKMIRGELFDTSKFHVYIQYLQTETAVQPSILTNKIHFENTKTIEEQRDEYRSEHNITPEQSQATALKRKEQKDNLDKFYIITSPDVDVTLFRTSIRDGYKMADYFSTYFGQDTEVYYINTQSRNTHPQQFKARMELEFKNAHNIWSVYHKEFLPAFLEYILDTHAYDLSYDRKRTMWETNLEYDKNKKNSPKHKKSGHDSKRIGLPKIISRDDFLDSELHTTRSQKCKDTSDEVADMGRGEHMISKEEDDALTEYFEAEDKKYDGICERDIIDHPNYSNIMNRMGIIPYREILENEEHNKRTLI